MKKISATILSLALAVSASSLLAQQAPAKVQPVKVAAGTEGAPLIAGVGTGAIVAGAVVLTVAVAAGDSGDAPIATTTASGSR